MHERAREPEASRIGRPRTEPAPADHEVLALQRQAGNQAVQRMLQATGTLARDRKPKPTRLGVEPVEDLYSGGTSADAWASTLRDGKDPHYVALYSEIAGLLHATVIPDVKGTGPKEIHTALRPAADELEPGLNFVARLEDRGQTGYLYDGVYSGKLPTTRDGPAPKVAVSLGPHAFEASNKASTLAVLRHELEHAGHDVMAAGWLKRWREDGRAAKQSFSGWLSKQSLAAADRALVDERVAGTKVNTEALAHLEGFIAGFPLEAASAAKGAHPVYDELEVAADDWLGSDPAVKDEMAARLVALQDRLKGERRTAFGAVLAQLKAHDPSLAKLVDPLVARQ